MLLQSTFIYIVAGVTSMMGFLFAVKRLEMKAITLRPVMRELFQCVGAFVVFLAINIVVGTTAVFLIRGASRFLPLYTVGDVMLILLSAFQGFIFQLWWRLTRPL